MATEITITVDTGGTGDYTGVQDALNAIAGSLVDTVYTIKTKKTTGVNDTTKLDIPQTFDMDATSKVIIESDTGYEAGLSGWLSSAYTISVTDDLAIDAQNFGSGIHKFEFRNIQIERVFVATTFSNTIFIQNVTAGSTYDFQGCRIRTNNTTTRLFRINDADAVVNIYTSILEGVNRYGVDIAAGTVNIYNSIVKDSATVGVNIAVGCTAVIKNNAIFDNADDIADSATSTIDYNASDDGDGTNAVSPSGASWANEFTDPTTGDFTLLNTGNLYQGGTDNPGSGLYTTDIEGDSYNTPWDIGPDSYTASGFTLTITSAAGTVTKDPDTPTYSTDTVVTLTASPNTGYEFTSWSGDITSTSNPTTVTMDANKNITANYSVKANHVISASTSQADFDTAVASAIDGDTIVIPSGSATWTATSNIPDAKKLYITGSGTLGTIITCNHITNYRETIDLQKSNSYVTNIDFIVERSALTTAIYVNGDSFRIYANRFTNSERATGSSDAIRAYSDTADAAHCQGLVDNNTFTGSRVLIYGCNGLAGQNYLWNQPTNHGSANFVFIEDNTFDDFTGNCVDANYGGRYVFRNNTTNDAQVMTHSIQGNERATRAFEVYNNVMSQTLHSEYVPFFLRGGVGVVWDNTVTGTWTVAAIGIDNKRSYEAQATSGIADGSSLWDMNTPAADGLGTHTGTNNAATLTDSTKTWNIITGTHTGSNNASVLTDSTKTWTVNELVGMGILNTTDSSRGVISENTTNTITVTMNNGTDDDFDTGDSYKIIPGLYVRNTTDNSGGYITDATETTISATLSGGTDNDFDTGDAYEISNGYQARDQIGRGIDASLWDGTGQAPDQASEPMYLWGNTINGSAMNAQVLNNTKHHIQENRDYYETEKAGYTAYIYPHPLRQVESADNKSVFKSTTDDIFKNIFE